jgi:hypothetical protein
MTKAERIDKIRTKLKQDGRKINWVAEQIMYSPSAVYQLFSKDEEGTLKESRGSLRMITLIEKLLWNTGN